MITEKKAYDIAVDEISKDFPKERIKTMYDIGKKYMFIFEKFEILVLVNKDDGESTRMHVLTAMLEYPNIEEYPRIDFR